jgi:2-oxoglutarate ferredoxin oxidoreductase subunit gamma
MKLGVRMYGMGGQGIITLAKLVGEATVEDGKYVMMTEEYSPYVTGGWSKANLVISDEAVDYPIPEEINYLVTLSQEGLDVNISDLNAKSKIITERSLVSVPDSLKEECVEIPAIEISKELKNPKGANVVLMGAFSGLTRVFSEESGERAIAKRFPKYIDANVSCFEKGYEEGKKHGR